MFLVPLCFLCAAHTLHCLARYFFFPSPPPTIFLSLCFLKSPDSLPDGSCLGSLLWQLKFHQNLTHFNSGLLISRTFLPHARSSCAVLCLYLVSTAQKTALNSTQFSRYSTTFFWPFYSFLQN